MRWLRRLRGTRIRLWYHAAFRLPLSGVASDIGIDPRRADDLVTWALDTHLVHSGDVASPPECPWDVLELAHTPEWLTRLDDPHTVAAVLGLDARVINTAAWLETWRRTVAGVVEAARYTISTRTPAAVLLGGYHHAFPDRGTGFCAVNDIAIAIRLLRRDGFAGRITVLDFDAHPPDGLQACLDGVSEVQLISVSADSEWPLDPDSTTIDLRVPRGSDDAVMLKAVKQALGAMDAPDLVFYLAGADPLVGDRFGALAVSAAGLRQRDRMVAQALGDTPVVAVPAGGYTSQAWRVFAGTIAELAGDRLEVDPDYDPVRRRTTVIARQLNPEALGAQDDLISTEELYAALGIARGEKRFLEYYTRHGLEYALHQYGILDSVRRMGFTGVQVTMTADGYPHRLRVSAEGLTTPLMDLSLRFLPVHGYRTLHIDWLELRDPRMPFTKDRPRLPGQQYPGLGLAHEVTEVTYRAARRLDLAGLSHTPSHYHIAVMTSGRMVFVEPEARGHFDALREYFQGVSLARASWLLHDGLQLEDGTPYTWQPSLMAQGIDDGLSKRLSGDRDRTRAARESLLLALAPLSAQSRVTR